MRWITSVIVLCVAGCQLLAKDPPVFPKPPRLAATQKELDERKGAPDFEKVKKGAVNAGQKLLKNPVTIPDGPGNWYFYYACPDCGAYLKPLSPTEHQCPQCKKTYGDERTVGAYRCTLHYNLERAVEQLGWAYAYSGDDRYAAEVKRILSALADAYDTYPERWDRWGRKGFLAHLGGRRYAQSLDEAVGVIKLAKGYDLTRNSTVWSDKDRKHVEDDFFRLTAATLLRFNQGINNHQTWYNAGLMAIASVLADAEMVEKVLTMPGGFNYQLERSIGSDGLWYEGTIAYHNYALQAMVHIVEAGRRMGLKLHEEPKFKAMILGPLRAAYPSGQFPAINDSDYSHIGSFRGRFLWAWKLYREPVFAQAYAQGDAKIVHKLLGEKAAVEWPLFPGSTNLSDAGLMRMQVGAGAQAACVFLDYGLHGGGHGHFDKLNVVLYAMGREWMLDPGRLTYSHKEYKTWVKHTAAHNTVALGGRSQGATKGRLLWFKSGEGWAACAAESKGAYTGATLTRYLLLTEGMLVDVFDVAAGKTTQVDWFAHAVSSAARPVEERGEGAAEAPGTGSGYEHLTDGRAWEVEGDSHWDFVGADGKKLRLLLVGDAAEKVFVANGIGYRINQKVPCLIRRRRAQRTRFVTIYDLTGDASGIRKATATPAGVPAVHVETPAGAWNVTFGADSVTVAREKAAVP